MEEYFRFKYYQEIFAVVFVGLIIVVFALIFFIWIITDKIKDSYDSPQELRRLNLKRLFTNQKLLLKELDYYIYKEENKNLAYESLQNIIVINEVISKKLDKVK